MSDEEEIKNRVESMFSCKCASKYSIEPYGDGYAIYFGRCSHMHGNNVAMLTECSREDIIKSFEKKLNQPEILFQSDASGLWYENKLAAGDYSKIKIAGREFEAI